MGANLLITYVTMFVLPLAPKYRRFSWRLGTGGKISITCGLIADALILLLIFLLCLDRDVWGTPEGTFMSVQEIIATVVGCLAALDLIILAVGCIMRMNEMEKYCLTHLTERQTAEWEYEMRRAPEPYPGRNLGPWPAQQVSCEQWNSLKYSWIKYREWRYSSKSFQEWLEDHKQSNPRLYESEVERSKNEALREWASTYEYLNSV